MNRYELIFQAFCGKGEPLILYY